MAQAQICRDPNLQAKIYQYNIKQPQSCSDVHEKIKNLQNQLKALEAERRKLISTNRWNVFLSEAVLWTSLVAKTSYAFVDLAGSVGKAVLPKPLGEAVSATSTVATNMFHVAETTGNLMSGNISKHEATAQNIGSFSNILVSTMPSGANKDIAQFGVDSSTATYSLLNSAFNGGVQDSKAATHDLAFAHFNFALSSLNTHGVPVAGRIQGAVKTVHAAQKYSDALDKILSDHLSNKEWTRRGKADIQNFYNRKMIEIQKKLDQALQQLEGCML